MGDPYLANVGAFSYMANGGSKLIAAAIFDKLSVKPVLFSILALQMFVNWTVPYYDKNEFVYMTNMILT